MQPVPDDTPRLRIADGSATPLHVMTILRSTLTSAALPLFGLCIGTSCRPVPHEALSRPMMTAAAETTKYLSVWRRQSDGTYLFVIDAGNARPAPPP